MSQSYTRQSTFADGDTITAALFNNEYNQLVNAFSYSSTNEGTTGHRHDGSAGEGGNIPQIGDLDFLNKIVVDSTNNRWGFYVQVSSSAVEQIRLQDGALIPVTDSDVDLGTSSLYFKDAYIDSVTTTGNVSIGGNLTVTGNAIISGNLTFGDADTDSINLAAEIDSNVIPNTDNTYDLGSSSKEWKDIYIDGTAYLDAINFNGTAITSTAAELNILDGVTSTAAELNILDGVTATTAEINTLDGITSTVAELNILDGVTATSTEINILDGVTSTTAELNILDGVTANAAELNILDGVTSTTAELNILDGVTSTAAELNILDGKAFLDEDNMVSNSATGIASQQSIKAYVDAQVTAQDLDIITDSGTIAIDLDSENLTISGGTGLDSSATGNTVTLAIDSTVTTLTGTQTLTNKTLTTPVISSISNTGTLTLPTSTDTLVGRATTDTLTNKTLTSATLTSPVINTGVSGTAFLDDDTFATATASTLASSESIKAYVDSQVATADSLAEVLANGNTTGGTDIAVGTGDDITFANSSKAQFGDSNDLQIYHDGSHSYIKDAGTGQIKVLAGTNFQVLDTTGTNFAANFAAGGESQIYYNGDLKLKTTSTGIDVTGNIESDTVTIGVSSVAGSEKLRVNGTVLTLGGSVSTPAIGIGDTNTGVYAPSAGELGWTVNGTQRLFLDSTGIDVTGTVVSDGLTVSTAGNLTALLDSTSGTPKLQFRSGSGTLSSFIQGGVGGTANLSFQTNGTTERMRIDSSGNVGIGVTNPSRKLTVSESSQYAMNTLNPTSTAGNKSGIAFHGLNSASLTQFYAGISANFDNTAGGAQSGSLIFETINSNSISEKMRIDSSGKVGIGTASPLAKLHIDSNDTTNGDLMIGGNSDPMGFACEYIGNNDIKLHVGRKFSSDATFGKLVTFDDSGNVGIGTTSPERPLHIASATPYIVFDETDASQKFSMGSGGGKFFLYDETDSAQRLTVDTSGNVGIGTDSPGTQLTLNKNDNNFLQIRSSDTGNAGIYFGRQNDSVRGAIVYDNSNESIQFLNNNYNEKMRIDSSGNVGIGTSSPNAALDAVGSSNVVGEFTSTATSKSNNTYTLMVDSSAHTSNLSSAGAMSVDVNSGRAFTINGLGRVGIGTASPNQMLELSANNGAGAINVLRFNDSDTAVASGQTTGRIEFAENDGGDTTVSAFLEVETVATAGGGIMTFGTGTAGVTADEKMRIDSSGNVGIGTSSPSFKLDVAGNARAAYFALRSNESAPSESAFIYRPSTGVLGFGTSTAERMRIDSSGNVLVGTTDSSPFNNSANTSADNGIALGNAGNVYAARYNFSPLDLNRTGSDGDIIALRKSGAIVGSISVTSSATTYNTSSDARLKDVTGEARGLEVINELNPVSYNWKADGKADEGLIAQEVQEIVPNAVSGSEEEHYQMDYSKLVVHLVKAVKEQQTQIKALQSEINLLKTGE